MCEYCNYVTYKKYLLLRHMKNSHVDKTPHRCSDCGKRFEILASLFTHIDVHTCKYCEKSFTTSRVKSICMKDHTNDLIATT